MIPDFNTVWPMMQTILADFGGLVQIMAGVWVGGLVLRSVIGALGVRRQRVEEEDV